MGKRWQYAVATESGWVEKRPECLGSYSSCYVVLRGKSGTHYWYIHLNNDNPGGPANDNQGELPERDLVAARAPERTARTRGTEWSGSSATPATRTEFSPTSTSRCIRTAAAR